jgi:hypothetical protein
LLDGWLVVYPTNQLSNKQTIFIGGVIPLGLCRAPDGKRLLIEPRHSTSIRLDGSSGAYLSRFAPGAVTEQPEAGGAA